MIGESTAGKLFSFITAFMLAYEPMKRLARLNNTMQLGMAAVERLYDLLDLQPRIQSRPDAQPVALRNAVISVEDVRFTYADGTEALQGVTLQAPAGRTVALVGASGSGKSTLLNLLPRFYDVSSGRILINGQDIRDIRLESLRGNMALVSQEVAIFNDTVRQNIAYGRPDAEEADIIAAAKSAAAHDFIMDLPQGYDTMVGEHGVKLSGGQRQRISIARAFLRDAPILLLDEATSALDSQSERLIQQAVERLQSGKTTIVVAHRLSTIIGADIIYVMDQGRVIEQGSHAALLAGNGAYARLYGEMARESA
jgi:subfamily B ATP-binding cassette protein MsbA